jgi:hypothetical protein
MPATSPLAWFPQSTYTLIAIAPPVSWALNGTATAEPAGAVSLDGSIDWSPKSTGSLPTSVMPFPLPV